MPDQQTTRRTRFARLYEDGSLVVVPASRDFVAARGDLIASSDDDDTELLELEVTVIRTHGKPKLRAVREHSTTCPCCGEAVSVEVPANG
jgi:hypothetical protein